MTGLVVISSTNVAPFHGTAIMDSVGNVELGITGYGMLDGISNVMIHAATDSTFNGTGQLDTDGDFAADPAVVGTLLPVDCKTVVIP